MEPYRIPWTLHRVLWKCMEMHAASMELHRISWKSMEFQGIPWTSMEFHVVILHGDTNANHAQNMQN